MRTYLYLLIGLVGVTVGLRAEPLHLQTQTEAQWNLYLTAAKARVTDEAERQEKFLAVDCSSNLRERVRAGEIVVMPSSRNGYESVPSGLIHSWTGSVFLPNATLRSVAQRVQSFEEYPSIYHPSIVSAKVLSKTDDEFIYSFVLAQKVMLIDSALDGEYRSTFYRVSSTRLYSFTESTRLQEIANYGHANAKRYPADSGSGFIWRLASVAKYEEADGGVYIELEAMALSRSIPASLRWFVNPIVNRISRAAVTTTLRQTRAAGPADLDVEYPPLAKR